MMSKTSTARSDCRIILTAWLTASILLGFPCLTHLFSMASMLMGHQVLGRAAPLAPPHAWRVYEFHDPRISPPGPAYGMTFLLGTVLILWISFDRRMPRHLLWLGCAAILLSILINKQLWRARYAP